MILYELIIEKLIDYFYSNPPSFTPKSSSAKFYTGKRYYSTKNNSSNKNLTPEFITGLTHSDGSFYVEVNKRKQNKFGIYFTPCFAIVQDIDSISLLESIKNYFNCGRIEINLNSNCATYKISSIKDIKNVIIPHFERYPVYPSKLRSFLILKLFVNFKEKKLILNQKDYAEIIKLVYFMNVSSNRKIEGLIDLLKILGVEYYENLTSIHLPEILKQEEEIIIFNNPINEKFIVGLIDGDGSFCVVFNVDKNNKKTVQLKFEIIQHISCKELIDKIYSYFNCGTIYISKDKHVRYSVASINDLNCFIIPFMRKHTLLSYKANHYSIFIKVLEMISNKEHLSEEGLKKIIDLAYNMNKEGKRRKYTKEEFLNL
jgi:LAGLIDADG endonuclease